MLRYSLWILRTFVANIRGHAKVPVPSPSGIFFVNLMRSPFVPKAMYFGGYEPIETNFVLEHLAKFEKFVNIGANLGWYSVIAGVKGKEVLAFEPDLLNSTLLKKNLKINGVHDSRVFVAAASNSLGEAYLHGGNSGASLIAGWAGQANVSRKVQMVTFDLVADLHKDSPLVVIDVEGHELPVLEGMVQHLQSWTSALLMVEITGDQHHPSGTNPSRAAVFSLLQSMGYESWHLHLNGQVSPYLDWELETQSCTFIFSKNFRALQSPAPN